jgi:L-alanine-DL-glutamate epimerase-like enolase superfamily enzyme
MHQSHLCMNMATYDLMDKELGVPAWKLIGPRVRSWMPVAAWTVSQEPQAMAEEVLQAAQRGYHWMKYHVAEIHNVIDQVEHWIMRRSPTPAGGVARGGFSGGGGVGRPTPCR